MSSRPVLGPDRGQRDDENIRLHASLDGLGTEGEGVPVRASVTGRPGVFAEDREVTTGYGEKEGNGREGRGWGS